MRKRQPVRPCCSPVEIDGKWRYCERAKGHTGRHMARYCGVRRYWPAKGGGV